MADQQTKLERAIAKAIYESRNGFGCKPWHHLTNDHKEPYLNDARAALAVIEEDTRGKKAT